MSVISPRLIQPPQLYPLDTLWPLEEAFQMTSILRRRIGLDDCVWMAIKQTLRSVFLLFSSTKNSLINSELAAECTRDLKEFEISSWLMLNYTVPNAETCQIGRNAILAVSIIFSLGQHPLPFQNIY